MSEVTTSPTPDILQRGNVRVEFVELGEGLSGDYDESDPNDVELLRFDVSVLRDGEWEEVEGASYCTRTRVTATPEERQKLLHILMNCFYSGVSGGKSIKRDAERLSWIGLDNIRAVDPVPL